MMIFIKTTLLAVVCAVAYGSVIHEAQPAPAGAAPIVTAASSQYFERIFNRLIAAPVLEQVPVAPVLPAPPHVIPASAPPPIIVEATRTTVLPAPPTSPPQNQPTDPNVAIAVATANVAAPVATILLPPYPFGFPPGFNFIPQPVANFPNQDRKEESTTQASTKTMKTTTQTDQEAITPVPSNIDSSFVQALPSNENANVFRQYFAPQPQPPRQIPQIPAHQPHIPQHIPEQRPIKLKTTVEVVPVPLTYIAPPPESLHHHHHNHNPHHSLKLKVPHIHTYIPKTKIIIIKPRLEAYRIIRIPHGYRAKQRIALRRISNQSSREVEPTTFRPINRPFTKPPRV